MGCWALWIVLKSYRSYNPCSYMNGIGSVMIASAKCVDHSVTIRSLLNEKDLLLLQQIFLKLIKVYLPVLQEP